MLWKKAVDLGKISDKWHIRSYNFGEKLANIWELFIHIYTLFWPCICAGIKWQTSLQRHSPNRKNKQSRTPLSETARPNETQTKNTPECSKGKFRVTWRGSCSNLVKKHFFWPSNWCYAFLRHKAWISCLPVSNALFSFHLDAWNVSTTHFDFQVSSRPTHPICEN